MHLKKNGIVIKQLFEAHLNSKQLLNTLYKADDVILKQYF